MPPARRLDQLRIVESSGVNRPANQADGWLVIKNDGTGPKPRPTQAADPKVRVPQIRQALADRAEELGVTVAAARLDSLAASAYQHEEKGTPFRADEWDHELAPAKPKTAAQAAVALTVRAKALGVDLHPTDAAELGALVAQGKATKNMDDALQSCAAVRKAAVRKVDGDDLVTRALRARAALLGVAVTDTDLARIAAMVTAPAQDGFPFSPSDWDPELLAAGTRLPGPPPTPGTTSRTPPTLPSHQAEGHPSGDGTLTKAAADRERHLGRQLAASAAELEQQGMPHDEAVRRVSTEFARRVTPTDLEVAEKHFVAQGMGAAQAKRAAADAVLKLKRAELVDRAAKPGVPDAVLEAAATIKSARIAKGLSVAEVAEEAGVTSRAVQMWESAERSPEGVSLWKLGDALGLTVDQVRQIGTARGEG